MYVIHVVLDGKEHSYECLPDSLLQELRGLADWQHHPHGFLAAAHGILESFWIASS